MTITCPEEDVLFGLAMQEPIAEELAAHTLTCSVCQQRLGELRQGVVTLRNLWANNTVGPSVTPSTTGRPALIGKYLIVGTLGEGAQANVYRGLHPTLNKEVVIKLGKHAIEPDAAGRAHLVNEGKLLARLAHPGLARVLDLDFHEGRPYLVMEYVRGAHLEDWAATNQPPASQAARIVAGLARALAVAHAQGIVHHDIKPRNVLIDDEGRPVLIDFGLALLRQTGSASDSEGGAPGGTLAYMAPEHARGEVEHIGQATDLFGLGGVLYFLLTGSPVFQAADAFLVHQKAMRCESDLTSLDRPGIPRELARLTRQALSARPEDRPASATAFAESLEALSRPKRTWPWLAVLAALVLVGCATWLATRPRQPAESPLPAAPGMQSLVRLHARIQAGKVQRFRTMPFPGQVQQDDTVDLVVEVPAGSEAVLYRLDCQGKLHQGDLSPMEEGNLGPRLIGPAKGALRIGSGAGTELFLVVAARAGKALPALAEMETLLRDAGATSLPALHADGPALAFFPGGVKEVAPPELRGLGEEVTTPLTEVRKRLDTLRQALLRKYDWCWGVAIPHS